MINIVTIVNSISTTSMPMNEFVLYRSKNGASVKQFVVVWGQKKTKEFDNSKNIDIYYIGNNFLLLRRIISNIKRHCERNGDMIVYHAHQPKSALFFLFSTCFLGIRKSTLFTVHSSFSSRNLMYKFMSGITTLLCCYTSFVSESAYNSYPSFIKKLKGSSYMIIRNGVDINRIDKSIENINPCFDMKRIVCVGRIISIKNQEFLIRVIKKLPDVKLVLIGAEFDDYNLRKVVKYEGLDDRVIFTGILKREMVFKEITRCGIYVSASTVEGMPVSVLEAMRVGLLPVLSDINPHREIKKASNEVCVLPLNELLWVNEIKKLIETDEKQLCLMRAHLKNEAAQKFSLDYMHSNYDMLYKVIVGDRDVKINQDNV